MKHFNLLLFVLLLTFSACGEKEDLDMATVVKACEGTFLQMDNTVYQVCNEEVLAKLDSGAKLNVQVKHLDKCDEFKPRVCTGPVLSGEWVKVLYTY